jgi:hypothetical protein
MRFSIDIDGVIGTKEKWTFEENYKRQKEMFMAIPVNKKIINKINKLYLKGHTIILNTSRLWYDYDTTREWLNKYGVKYHTLIMAKPLADFYIDDKNKSVDEFLKMK